MSRQTKPSKPSRNIPEHIKRAVNACEHHICQNCAVVKGLCEEVVNKDSTFVAYIPGRYRNTAHRYDAVGVFNEAFNLLLPFCGILLPPAKTGDEDTRDTYIKQTAERLSARLVEMYHSRAIKEFFAAQESFLTVLLDEVLLNWCREELAQYVSPEALQQIKALLEQQRASIYSDKRRYVHGEKEARRPRRTEAEKKGVLVDKRTRVLTESVEIVRRLRANMTHVTFTDVARERHDHPNVSIEDQRSKYSRELGKTQQTEKISHRNLRNFKRPVV